MAARTIGKPDLERLRVCFGKDGRLAYLGHLEIINTTMRSVRRSGLPFTVSTGFARRMRIQFSQALPVGAASVGEYYDLYLSERIDEALALEALRRAAPPALAPRAVCYIKGRVPALEAWLTRARWQVRLLGQGDAFCSQALDEAFRSLREERILHFMRGDKPRTIDLGSTLLDWELSDGRSEGAWKAIDLVLDTRSSNLGALRPAVLIEGAFGLAELEAASLDSLRVVRAGQWHECDDGTLMDPMAPEICG